MFDKMFEIEWWVEMGRDDGGWEISKGGTGGWRGGNGVQDSVRVQ